MTIEEVLGYSTDDLELWLKQSPEKIQELFGHYFQYTRPDMATNLNIEVVKEPRVRKQTKAVKDAIDRVNLKSQVNELLTMCGVDPKTLKPKV